MKNINKDNVSDDSPKSDKEYVIAEYENDEAYLLEPNTNQLRSQIQNEDLEYEPLNQNENHIEKENEIQNYRNEAYDLDIENKDNNEAMSDNKFSQKSINIIDSRNTLQQEHQSLRQFISLSSLSKCQYCNEEFNTSTNLPLLFKCGHFFCKQCTESNFIEDNNIKCPNNCAIIQTTSDLKVLEKLISDLPQLSHESLLEEPQYHKLPVQKTNQIPSVGKDDIYCKIHKDQKLTHFVEETREVICVYCAINKMRNGQKLDVKEINEKCKEYIEDIERITDSNKKFYEMLQQIQDISVNNKTITENKVTDLYDKIIQYLNDNKNNLLSKIKELSNENENNLQQKQDYLINKIESGDNLTKELNSTSNSASKFNELADKYNTFIRDANDNTLQEVIVNEYNFSHNDENKIMKYLNEFGDLKSKKKTYSNTIPINNENILSLSSMIQNENLIIDNNDTPSTTTNNINFNLNKPSTIISSSNRKKSSGSNPKIYKNYYTSTIKNDVLDNGNNFDFVIPSGFSHVNTGNNTLTNENNRDNLITVGNNSNNHNHHQHNRYQNQQMRMKYVDIDNIKRSSAKHYDNDLDNNNNMNINQTGKISNLDKYNFTPKVEQNYYTSARKKNF